MPQLSHLDAAGRAQMVDVGGKQNTRREAVARAEVRVCAELRSLLAEGSVPKGDVFAVARVAAIQAAKRTGELIPLCHPLGLDVVEIDFRLLEDRVQIRVVTRCTGKTGVEMEALTAASVAALTIYDMGKAVDKGMVIGPVWLDAKSGGRSGDFTRQEIPAEASPWR